MTQRTGRQALPFWVLADFLRCLPLWIILTLVSGCASQKPWQSEGITEIRFLDGHFTVLRTFSDQEDLDALTAAMRAAVPSPPTLGESRPWTHKVDILGTTPESGRWLYARETGEFTRLTAAPSPVFSLTLADRATFAQFLQARPSSGL